MSLNEERIMILKMLQEGKINSEEAARLLEALDGGQKQSAGDNTSNKQQKQQANYYDEVAKFREKINDWKNEFTKNYNQKDFDKMIDDFSVKAEKVGKNVASATFGIVDRIADYVGSVVDTGTFSIFGNCSMIEKSYEAAVQEGTDLFIEGINGQIVVKKHSEENRLIIKSKIRSPKNYSDDILVFTNSGDTISLKPACSDYLSISHEILLPPVKFNKIILKTKNGKIYAEDSLSQEFESITKNSMIDLMGVNSDKIQLATSNGKINVNYVIGKEIDINTKNSAIDIKSIKVEKLNASTANGRINVDNVHNYENTSEINIELKTKNGGIKANMNDSENRAYKIKAQTTNGGINLLVPELLYHDTNKQHSFGKYVDAESSTYNTNPKRVNIYAETTNGYIEVVK